MWSMVESLFSVAKYVLKPFDDALKEKKKPKDGRLSAIKQPYLRMLRLAHVMNNFFLRDDGGGPHV